jgi:hypothetical protein
MDRPDTHHDALEFPNGETDVDFGLGVSLADEAAARSRVSQLSP